MTDTGIGNSTEHDSAFGHVTGQAKYIDDLPELPNTVHLAFGRSDHAHANILHMDLDEVLATKGVVAVFTAKDIPGQNTVGPVQDDEPLLANDRVIYHGQAIFVVAATSRTIARKAARKAKISYEPLPVILNISQARAQNARLEPAQIMQRGNAKSAIKNADFRASGKMETGPQDHFYLEGQIAYVQPGEQNQLKIFSSTQHPSEIQTGIGHLLGIESHLLSVEVRRLGGGFGGKETQALLIAGAAALAAHHLGRPAKLCLDRDDDMAMTGKRHGFEMSYQVGFDKKGRIDGIEMDLASDCGCSLDLSAAINDRAMFHADNAYYLPQISIRSERFMTHKVSATAFRGFGGPQGMILIERVMDHIASDLQLDPYLVRKRNFYTRKNNTTPYGQKITEFEIPAICRELVASSEYQTRRKQINSWNQTHKHKKRGISLSPVKFGISFTTTFLNQAGALVQVYRDGSVLLNHGGTEMGQGLFVKVAQITANEFGLPIRKVKCSATATDKVPNTSATAASSGSDMNGMAAQYAAREIRNRLAKVFVKIHGGTTHQLRFENEMVCSENAKMSFCELVEQAYLQRISLSSTGFYATPEIFYDRETHQGHPFFYYAYGAAISEVELDTITGEAQIVRTDILHSAGKSLNPAIDLGQIEGGFMQGLGWLTNEELCFDKQGQLTTHAPSTYKIPTARDRPDHFNLALYASKGTRAKTVHRSKAVGEPPFMLAISVHGALREAVQAAKKNRGFACLNAPATPEALLSAIQPDDLAK